MVQKQVATPKDKIAEDKAIKIQQELYLLEEKPSNDANARRRKKLQSQLSAFVSNIVGDNELGGGRQRILDVVKQAAMARNRADRGDPPKKTVATPKSPPDKTFKELYNERIEKGRGSEYTPSGGERIIAGLSALKRKVMGDDKRKLYDAKGGLAKPKMMGGGMAYGKKHMYVAGGSVTENRKKK